MKKLEKKSHFSETNITHLSDHILPFTEKDKVHNKLEEFMQQHHDVILGLIPKNLHERISVAGGSLANLYYATKMGQSTPKVNDIDVFIPLYPKELPDKKLETIFSYDQYNTARFSHYLEHKDEDRNIIRKDYLLINTERHGLYNLIYYLVPDGSFDIHNPSPLNPQDIIRCFDLNCTKVAYNFKTKRFYHTLRFSEFCEEGVIKIDAYDSPLSSLARAIKKNRDLKGTKFYKEAIMKAYSHIFQDIDFTHSKLKEDKKNILKEQDWLNLFHYDEENNLLKNISENYEDFWFDKDESFPVLKHSRFSILVNYYILEPLHQERFRELFDINYLTVQDFYSYIKNPCLLKEKDYRHLINTMTPILKEIPYLSSIKYLSKDFQLIFKLIRDVIATEKSNYTLLSYLKLNILNDRHRELKKQTIEELVQFTKDHYTKEMPKLMENTNFEEVEAYTPIKQHSYIKKQEISLFKDLSLSIQSTRRKNPLIKAFIYRGRYSFSQDIVLGLNQKDDDVYILAHLNDSNQILEEINKFLVEEKFLEECAGDTRNETRTLSLLKRLLERPNIYAIEKDIPF